MKTLDQIGIETGTDKSSKGHNYLKYYEQFLNPLKDKPIKLLEMGIWHGDSLRMWKEYFPVAQIIGMDYEDMSQYKDERTQIVQCDEADGNQLHELFYGTNIDVIVNDASHQGHAQIISFETLFPLMNSGGLYFIEDLLCSYHHWAEKDSFISYIKRQLVDDIQMNGKIPHDKLCSDKSKMVYDYSGSYLQKNIEWIFVSMGLCVIKKL